MWDLIKNLSVTDILKILATVASIIFGIVVWLKGRKNAKTANEEFVFQANLFETILTAMEDCEKILTPLKNALGSSVSSMKLDNVLQKVQNYCLTNNKPFDKDKVEKIINDLIDFSKTVNYKKSV